MTTKFNGTLGHSIGNSQGEMIYKEVLFGLMVLEGKGLNSMSQTQMLSSRLRPFVLVVMRVLYPCALSHPYKANRT